MNKKENITIEERQKLDEMLSKYEISKAEVASEAQVSYRSVMYYFKGRDSRHIDRAVKRLISQKIYDEQKKTSEMTRDLCSLY